MIETSKRDPELPSRAEAPRLEVSLGVVSRAFPWFEVNPR